MPTFDRSGTSLYYEQLGSGPSVLLLHGFTTSLVGNWQQRGWFELLAGAGFHVLALDFPSHGRSDRVYDDVRCAPTVLAADVLALLDHLRVRKAALVGFSMGGGVALNAASAQPSRVSKLVIGGVGDNTLNRLHDPRELAALSAAFEARDIDGIENENARRIRRNAELAGREPRALLPYLRHGGWPGGLTETNPIRVPVLLIVAAADQYMGETQALRQWLDHAKVLEVANRDHHDVLDDDAVRRGVVAFLRECAGW